MKTTFKSSLISLLAYSLIMTACEKKDDLISHIPGVDIDLPADKGETGLVIDVREIFRKGYIPATASVSLPGDYADFNEILDIDPALNIASFRIQNDDLTPQQIDELESGILIDIIIRDAGNQILSSYHDQAVLDASGIPLRLVTSLPFLAPPVKLKEDIPYYIQPDEVGGDGNFVEGGVLVSLTPLLYEFRLPDDAVFNFKYFVKPASDSTYYLLRANNATPQVATFYFFLDPASANPDLLRVNEEESTALQFAFDQEEDGWVRIRAAGTNRYLTISEGTSSTTNHDKALYMLPATNHRFRFITKYINWSAEDKGTIYQQPIMPPAQITFAYGSTITNCTPGPLSETVGITQTKTSTRSLETTEGFQLFASAQATVGFKTGLEVGADVPLVGEVKASVEISTEYQFTTSVTRSTERKVTGEQSHVSEVSRTRTIELQPFSGVKVYDAVRAVANARTPFTQRVRIAANYTNSGSPLTGAEIRTQMMMNLMQGIVIETGPDYVEFTLRGNVSIDQMFETETGAEEVINACN